ncbi:hypothetical protein [Actinomadura opuntiae]|uniref:hypothetical protein n=1 Tax=Actinomadura sp. OS1-43 TaxID=604315 RepID=UPI00255B1701|nr:hypothetical protein [Actinomadura sp. OS1-43]MDL4814752.1 hypothetical protein [Actinomadura sp. OS1-43]
MRSAMKANRQALAGGSSGAPSGGSSGPGAGGGLGRSGLGTSGGQRLPVSPRERKPALAALAVLLILGGALASAYLVMASGQRVSAIRIAQPVAAGQRIPQSALEEVQVGDTGVQFVNWSERLNVSRYYAAVPLVKGALLTNGMISRTDEAAKGRLVVGLALKPGQLPSGGVESGKKVTLYAVGSGGGPRAGTVLAAEAIVINVGGGGGSRLRSDQTNVDVAIAPADAAQVAQAASAGTVAIALIPEGTKAPGQASGGGAQGKQSPVPGDSQPPAGTGGEGTGNGTPGTGNGTPGTGGN